jgi:hypothetical protein
MTIDNILQYNKSYNKNKIVLDDPNRIEKGIYYSKLSYNKNPLYLRMNESISRSGIRENNDTKFIDLLFSETETEYIHFFKNIEDYIQELLVLKSCIWFPNVSVDDIEYLFISSIKPFKNKYITLRCYLNTSEYTKNHCIIFDEHKIRSSESTIKPKIRIASIIHIKGIYYTNSSFSLDVEIKQIKVIENNDIFEDCLFNSDDNSDENNTDSNNIVEYDEKVASENITDDMTIENNKDIDIDIDTSENIDNSQLTNTILKLENTNDKLLINNIEDNTSENNNELTQNNNELTQNNNELTQNNNELTQNNNELTQIEIDLDELISNKNIDNLDFKLKSPNELSNNMNRKQYKENISYNEKNIYNRKHKYKEKIRKQNELEELKRKYYEKRNKLMEKSKNKKKYMKNYDSDDSDDSDE